MVLGEMHMKVVQRLVCVVMLVTVLLVGCKNDPVSVFRRARGDPSEYTTPLDAATLEDVCRRFGLEGDRRCELGATVYAMEFIPEVRGAFVRGVSTREDVNALLGPYEYHCEPPVYTRRYDHTTYRCFYDLNGDRVFPVAFMFTDKDIVRYIYTPLVDS